MILYSRGRRGSRKWRGRVGIKQMLCFIDHRNKQRHDDHAFQLIWPEQEAKVNWFRVDTSLELLHFIGKQELVLVLTNLILVLTVILIFVYAQPFANHSAEYPLFQRSVVYKCFTSSKDKDIYFLDKPILMVYSLLHGPSSSPNCFSKHKTKDHKVQGTGL